MQDVIFLLFQYLVAPLVLSVINLPFVVELLKIVFVGAGLTGGLLWFAWANEKKLKLQRASFTTGK